MEEEPESLSEAESEEMKPKEEKKRLPAHLKKQRDYVMCGPETNSYTSIPSSAHAYMALGVDNSWDFYKFYKKFYIEVIRMTEDEIEFDMVGIDPALANAFRRILIAEVATMAIEHVFMVDNTSIIHDEMLAHRLGMVPLRVDPRLFDFRSAEEAPNEKNTLVFKLDVRCSWKDGKMVNEKVTTGMLRWLPKGSEMPDETNVRFASGQSALFKEGGEPMCVHDDILLVKMRPGQCVQLEAHAVKGIGHEHAKWSPVATAWYYLLPEVLLLQDVIGDMADEMKAECPGLFEVEGEGPQRRLVVNDPRLPAAKLHLEKARRLSGEDKWRDYIQVVKKKDHFIFTVQSSGVLPPDVLMEEAVKILAEKCDQLLNRL